MISEASSRKSITVRHVGKAPVPIHLSVYFADGRKISITRTAEIWLKNRDKVIVPFNATGRVERISLGNAYDADVDSQNNTWIDPDQ